MRYGYIRVSTKEQNIDRQLVAMEKENISVGNIFIDKVSGKDFNRKNYKRLTKKLKKGDELFVKSIDRLGRNYEQIICEWNYLVKKRGVDIIVLDFPLLDTRDKINNITGKFLADIVLQILSYVAQIERENTYKRQMEGIKEAKKKGIRFGRPKLLKPENYMEVYNLHNSGKISLREGAKILNVSHSTLSKWIKSTKIV
ncbi:recombinase family protein [Gemella cuniculi]|uniref:recombinase family protein n=1 Tax=Gemella cuniculi TaxID=150240 RepID=UPI0004045CF7|nr:recombinase family protein [Gemella cuniculi]